MKYPIVRTSQVEESYDRRIRLLVDLDAQKIDCLFVEMPLTGMAGIHVYDTNKEGWTFARLWSEAMDTARLLRRQPYVRVYPKSVLVPFVEITATDTARVSLRTRLQLASMIGCVGDPARAARWNDRASITARVNALGECVDLFVKLEGLVGRRALQ